MNYVLWLVSWYPNRTDKFAGDFIERHAKAVSQYCKLIIIFVTKDEKQTNKLEVKCIDEGNLIVYKAYYGKRAAGWIGKFISLGRYRYVQKKIFKQVVKDHGLPALVHVQVAMKSGLLALYIKKRYGIKYLVTEHWTGYFKTAVKNIYNSDILFRSFTKKILSAASLLLPVTKNLGETINAGLVKVPFKVIPNVVDTGLFYHLPAENKKFRFIHVSSMKEQKNPADIIRTAKLLWDEGAGFELVMVGPLNPAIKKLAAELLLSGSQIIFKDEIPYEEVAKEMQRSSAFVLFSTVENLPCVVLEALCCGLPVISSGVGGIKEVINSTNGILVEKGNKQQLKDAMKKIITDYKIYDRKLISEEAIAKFNYTSVGKQITNIYEEISSQ